MVVVVAVQTSSFYKMHLKVLSVQYGMVVAMDIPFTRIQCPNFLHEVLPLTRGKKVLAVKYGEKDSNGYFQGTSYYRVPKATETVLLDTMRIPLEYRYAFEIFLFVANRKEIPPHIDSNMRVTLNMYLKTSGASTTRFYKKLVDGGPRDKIENQTDGYMLDPSTLEETHSFVAREGEAWILDIKQPHSVMCETSDMRVAFSLQSEILSYSDMVNLVVKQFNVALECART